MMQKIKSVILTLATLSLTIMPTFALAPIAAADSPDITGNLCSGANLDATGTSSGNCTSSDISRGQLQNLLTTVINVFSIVVGVIAVIMIIVGGLRYITSGGDSGKVGAAKTTIIYALIGLVIVALAQIIVRFVLGQASTVIQQ